MKTQMQFQFWGLATAFCLATLATMTEATHGRYSCEAVVTEVLGYTCLDLCFVLDDVNTDSCHTPGGTSKGTRWSSLLRPAGK